MNVRTSRKSIVFSTPFSLTGVNARQPAGSYIIETDEAPVEGLSFLAYRRVSTRIALASDSKRPGVVETVEVDPADMEMISRQGQQASS